ncbi:hypothetical protein SAMN04488085_103287 [Geodermatophilus ruber]|uniref:Uncharacterized protein n=1 Tax=Geodermatophilus ruber TaxID=504800 RepID=A0A1I4C2D7_9ACTN|nr:hypothetical protein SAMN04488085_103287 [Geodermatophilus ruber]
MPASPAPVSGWNPWACYGCSLPIGGTGPVALCHVHEAGFQNHWAPAGITRDEAITDGAIELDLLALHAVLARGLNTWLTKHEPDVDLDVHAHVAEALRAHTDRVTARTVVVRMSPTDVRQMRGLGPSDRDAVIHRAAVGTTAYRCPAIAGLVWRLSGVEPEVANRFEERMRERGRTTGGTRCQPTSRVEVVEAPHLHPLLAWSAARDWQRHLTGDPEAEVNPALLADVADQLDRHWPYFRRPRSMEAYRHHGFTDDDAVAWHRLLVQTGAVTSGEGAADTATSWRDTDFEPDDVVAWLGDPADVLHGRTPFQREPRRHAHLRDVGFPALTDALPWLELWERHPGMTATELFDHWRTGTPVEWADAFEDSPGRR